MNSELNYIESVIKINPNIRKNRDILTAFLNENGFESYMETEEGLNAYILQAHFKESLISEITDQNFDFKIKVSYSVIEDRDWNETWTENYFRPIIFGNELVVRASFHTDFPNSKREIIIDPKTAFGTGYHGTTYLLIEEILKTELKERSVLDMGTGTGILAILSKMKGSAYTLAVDNDPKAVINTKENILINNTPDIDIREGDINYLTDQRFDFICENIWKNIVINDIPVLSKSLNSKGILLVSGFYFKEYDEVKAAGEAAGLIFSEVKERDEWAMVKFIKA